MQRIPGRKLLARKIRKQEGASGLECCIAVEGGGETLVLSSDNDVFCLLTVSVWDRCKAIQVGIPFLRNAYS